jgi:3',5'-cyclic AMP phosphodiesterase CpdA
MVRVIVLSDLHLSPTHGFFWDNWCIARDFTNQAAPHAVVVNGDLSINGPDSDAELVFAASALAQLDAPVLALPGNHDVGDEPPGQDAHQIIDEQRIARWSAAIGDDRFVMEAEGWLLIGLNAQLLGSGLPREEEQDRWLDRQLTAAGTRPIALFLHKPLFIDDPTEEAETDASVQPAARVRLLARLDDVGVRLVVSGHLHQHRDRAVIGMRHLWAPAIAFAAARPLGGNAACGLLALDISADRVDVTLMRPDGLVSHDLAAIKGPYRFLREMPPSPPPAGLT